MSQHPKSGEPIHDALPVDGGGNGGGPSGGTDPGGTPVVKSTIPVYRISLDGFTVRQTRSFHQDTDYATLGVSVNGQPVPNSPQTLFVGNVNEDHFLDLAFNVSLPDPSARVTINYILVNSGHSNPSQMQSALDSGSGDMSNDPNIGSDPQSDSDTQQTSDGGNTGDGAWAQIVKVVGGWIVNLLTANCDGVIATNQIQTTGNELATLTQSGPFTKSKRFTGPSPSGCGTGDTDYTVTYSITRLN